MDKFIEDSIFCSVYYSKKDVDDEYASSQCFWVSKDKLDAFVEICKENKKYVEFCLDFTEEK